MRTCLICRRLKPQKRADKAETCGRSCGATLRERRRSARLLEGKDPRFTGLNRRERRLYVRGYMAGYQRAKYRYIGLGSVA